MYQEYKKCKFCDQTQAFDLQKYTIWSLPFSEENGLFPGAVWCNGPVLAGSGFSPRVPSLGITLQKATKY